MSDLRAVSENVEGQTVLGHVEAIPCPGPDRRWRCSLGMGHPGDHVPADPAVAHLIGLLNVQLDGVSKLKAERDELLAACKLLLSNVPVDCPSARAAIAKAEEGR